MKHIIQHGSDGFGHQLHGLFTCMIFHDINSIYFDGYWFSQKRFVFQHIHGKVANDCMNYLKQIGIEFYNKYNHKKITYKKYKHAHEIYHIPEKYEKDMLYSLDNVFCFDRAKLDESQTQQLYTNIKDMKDLVINKYLPPNTLKEKNIVIHIRLGDAMFTSRRDEIISYNQKLIQLVNKLNETYPDYTYYIHSDGDVSFLTDILKDKKVSFIVKPKSTHILEVLSDFIHSKIFISGAGSLSKVCTFFGDKELIIVHDDNRQNVDKKALRISEFCGM